jgi:hypothetical protein
MGIRFRPINSSNGSPKYNVSIFSEHLARILEQLYNEVHTVRNSKELFVKPKSHYSFDDSFKFV